MMLNIVVVSPMPSVRARTATAVSPGCLRSARAPWRRSVASDMVDSQAAHSAARAVAAWGSRGPHGATERGFGAKPHLIMPGTPGPGPPGGTVLRVPADLTHPPGERVPSRQPGPVPLRPTLERPSLGKAVRRGSRRSDIPWRRARARRAVRAAHVPAGNGLCRVRRPDARHRHRGQHGRVQHRRHRPGQAAPVPRPRPPRVGREHGQGRRAVGGHLAHLQPAGLAPAQPFVHGSSAPISRSSTTAATP